MEHIVIVDKLDFADELLGHLRALGTLKQYADVPTPVEVLSRLAGATIAISGWSTFDQDVIAQCASLRHIALALTATDPVDSAAAAALSTGSVAVSASAMWRNEAHCAMTSWSNVLHPEMAIVAPASRDSTSTGVGTSAYCFSVPSARRWPRSSSAKSSLSTMTICSITTPYHARSRCHT